MAWNLGDAASDLQILTQCAEIEYGAQLVLYPVPGGDHSALGRLLAGLASDRYPAAGTRVTWSRHTNTCP